MTNPYFHRSGNPVARSRGRSLPIRDEFEAIEDGFDLVETDLAAKLNVNNPSSTGTFTHMGGVADLDGATEVLVPTVTPNSDSTTKAASTAFVQSAIGGVVGAVPSQVGKRGAMLATNDVDVIYWQSGAVAAASYALLAQGII